MFGSNSSLPPPVGVGGGQVSESVDKADLLSYNFGSKKSRESVGLPLACDLSQRLTTSEFRSCEVRRILIDFYPYGGTYLFSMFSHFLKKTADIFMAPRFNVVFSAAS